MMRETQTISLHDFEAGKPFNINVYISKEEILAMLASMMKDRGIAINPGQIRVEYEWDFDSQEFCGVSFPMEMVPAPPPPSKPKDDDIPF